MDKPISGQAAVTPEGWLHIRLDALLPHCRYGSVSAISDAVTESLDNLGKAIPRFEAAMLFIDEHSNEQSRRVFDQDNKAWKAIPNALKGRIFPDDDQYTLAVSLLSKRSEEAVTHIWVVPMGDAFRYLKQRSKALGLTPRCFPGRLFFRKHF